MSSEPWKIIEEFEIDGIKWVRLKRYNREVIRPKEVPGPKKTYSTTAYGSATPFRSNALRVHPSQAKRFSEAAKEAGTGAYYDPKTGDMIAESRSARKWEWLRRGFGDNDAGYGDFGPDMVGDAFREPSASEAKQSEQTAVLNSLGVPNG